MLAAMIAASASAIGGGPSALGVGGSLSVFGVGVGGAGSAPAVDGVVGRTGSGLPVGIAGYQLGVNADGNASYPQNVSFSASVTTYNATFPFSLSSNDSNTPNFQAINASHPTTSVSNLNTTSASILIWSLDSLSVPSPTSNPQPNSLFSFSNSSSPCRSLTQFIDHYQNILAYYQMFYQYQNSS